MDLKVKADVLSAELELAAGVTSRKVTIPALAYVLVETEMGGVRLTGSDLDVTIRTSCPAEVITPGAVLLPARKTADLMKLFPGDSVVQITEGAKHDGKTKDVRVKAADYDGRLQVLPTQDYPQMPDVPAKTVSLFKCATLSEMIAQVSPCVASVQDNRYQLNGISMAYGDGKIIAVASDGHRLGLSEAVLDGSGDRDSVILPSKILGALRVLLKSEGEVAFVRDENHLFFSVGDKLLISRVIEGEFPKYERMIPSDANTVAAVGRDAMTSALRRVAVVSQSETDSSKVQIAGGTAVISAISADVGDATERVAAKIAGPDTDSTFRTQYVLDFLSACAPGDVSLTINDPMKAGLFQQLGDGPTKFKTVIMPVRL